MSALFYDIISGEFGSLVLVASENGLRFVNYYDTHSAARIDGMMRYTHAVKDAAKLQPYREAVLRYLSGQSKQLDIAMDIQGGTQLQRKVWEELSKIPYGSTISYTELAQRSGKPAAVRAVASACGKNPLPIIIPCHRVLAKDGTLGGFAWGVDKKAQLLALEQSDS